MDQTLAAINDPSTYGAVVVGPWGVGKTTLARAVEAALAETTHVVRLFGSPTETPVAYGSLAVWMARLAPGAADSPASIIHGLDRLIHDDADGRDVLLVIDDLPALDPMSVGVVMHLLLSGGAKALVLVRDGGQLPEDLVWLAKDGLLSEMRLDYFNRAEVGELVAKATRNLVSASAVTALHKASNGIPLVLQALFREQVASGSLKLRRGVWVLSGRVNADPDSALADIVRARLGRETEEVRLGVEKLSLLGTAPLSIVTAALGQETVWEMEERGFLAIDPAGRHHAQLSERYVGEIVRGSLDPERMMELLVELSEVLNHEVDSLDSQELMALAAWTLDAGLILEPRFGLAAARRALTQFDPQLALRCTVHIPPGHARFLEAVQLRSEAYGIVADYRGAVDVLDAVAPEQLAGLALQDYCQWVLALTGALLWVPEGYARIPGILAEAESRLRIDERRRRDAPPGAAVVPESVVPETAVPESELQAARQLLRLAYFEYQVHRGEFAEIVSELEEASHDPDLNFSLNCACLLVPTLAVLGRELDAVAVGHRVTKEIEDRGISLKFARHCRDGLTLALTWSGRWLESVDLLRSELETMPQTAQYRGGLLELSLGLAQAYAGRGSAAAEVLLAAAAQLEVRESDNALGLAYSALAFTLAQDNNEKDAMEYLALAASAGSPTLWTNRAMAEFFRLMALRWLDDPDAGEKLHASARADLRQGRYSTASMSLFGGTISGTEKDFALLEDVSLRRQGPMPEINVMLARSCRRHDPVLALEAAAAAQVLKLDAVESRCAVLALDFARETGANALAREAKQRLDRLTAKLARLPMQPHTEGVKLTQRELQVAKLAKRGLGNRAIAGRIGVSVRTVEGHLYQVYSKLGITSRSELEQDQEL
ncbi:helix-turn-helix transcriptional regulator [Arthrobacter sp. A2-55]|uniref:helix-turn-helix transcriptional regulator n=1 Tax=Arthrobacter sp. A2-55 TaxID=2897337 RepID=UPI0021CDCCE5|nr:LuxR C-terminal-related transcriptional regulator [Arthrobacter sp. A2-55]MCU6479888.1 LuxR C-terminal-related transcriptional regulator [Arthrobacter sp. A2-55]